MSTMQIINTWCFILLSSISLVSFFGPIHCAASLPRRDTSSYEGPGIYRINNYDTSLYVDLDGTEGGSLVRLQNASESESQRWEIANFVNGQVTISNNVDDKTKLYLSATKVGEPTRAYLTNNPRARWRIDSSIYPGAIVIYSVLFSDSVLDNHDSLPYPGTPVTVYPFNKPPVKNQAWVLKKA